MMGQSGLRRSVWLVGAVAAVAALAWGATSCGSDTDDRQPARSTVPSARDAISIADARATLTTVAKVEGTPTGLAFRPGDPAMYAAVREGRVLRIAPDGATAVVLDLTESVTLDGEGGVFDLGFTTDGKQLLVSYADKQTRSSVVTRIAIDPEGEPSGRPTKLVTVGAGGEIHNAGRLVVTDGGDVLLAVGDGGEWNAVAGRARRGGSERGRILRYEGLGRSNAPPIEPSTEAFGLRNPWRFFVDPVTADTWIGDVGQARWEEVDRIPAGHDGDPMDFGWDLTEGYERARGLAPAGMTYPTMVSPHDATHCAIVGGPIVRDGALPQLVGTLVLGDYCSSDVRFVRMDRSGQPIEQRTAELPPAAKVVSFAVGLDHAVYVLRTDGVISRIDAGGERLLPDPAPLVTEPTSTFTGSRSICGLSAAIAAYPEMQGKEPEEVAVLSSDLRAALDAYRSAELPDAARPAFEAIDTGLQQYLQLLEAAGWDTEAPSVQTATTDITAGAEDYAELLKVESRSCD